MRASRVSNKAPAARQITAEQILREAYDQRQKQQTQPSSKLAEHSIQDIRELKEYRSSKRREYEEGVRRYRYNASNWIKYALWEASQKEYDRARSVFERCISLDYKNHGVWLKYAEMEMKGGFVNRARNVWDRAVNLFPRMEQFWLKYSLMEEQLNNVQGAREVFERWMKWVPDPKAWYTYLKLEIRTGSMDRCRDILERFIVYHPEVESYIKYVSFEEKYGTVTNARSLYNRAFKELGNECVTSYFFISFAKFETRLREIERATRIYQVGLLKLKEAAESPHNDRDEIVKDASILYNAFLSFQKKFGESTSVETTILGKRRIEYESKTKTDPYNYDHWFDYIRLEKTVQDNYNGIVEVFERAISFIPESKLKQDWKRYIYIWINYAIYEELNGDNIDRVREIYKACLQVIPLKSFSFSKIWIYLAQFELRQMDIIAARKVLGIAIGKCPRPKLFKYYIELEIKLGKFQRCRIVYHKFIEYSPDYSDTWIKYAQFEESLGEVVRSRAIYELAISQAVLDSPETLWKAYIDFEVSQGNIEAARNLYDRLFQKTKHVKVWISRAQMESKLGHSTESNDLYLQAIQYFKEMGLKEQRLLVLESWRLTAKQNGDTAQVSKVDAMLPEKIKRKRPIVDASGSRVGYEEYIDYLFPDEQAQKAVDLSFLHAAKKWKQSLDQ